MILEHMSKPIPTKRRYTAMRQEIVQAAQQIIQHEGVDGLSMRSIARVVKTSPANLYEYFLNKEEIILSVYSDSLSALYEHLSMLELTNDARADLLALSQTYINFIIQDPSQIHIVSQALQIEGVIESQVDFSSRNQNSAQLREPQLAHTHCKMDSLRHANPILQLYQESVAGIYRLFVQAIERCQRSGTLKHSSNLMAKDIAHIIWAFTHGLVILSVQSISTIDQTTVQFALDTFLNGLG